MLQMVSGETSVAPRRWKKRIGKKKAMSEIVPVECVLRMVCGPAVAAIRLKRPAIAASAASHETGSNRPSPLGPTRRSGRVRRASGSRHSRL
jgi:hypothetical protein